MSPRTSMLDVAGFELALAKLADRGQAPPLPARVQANEATIPLALVDTGKELLAGPLLRPQFGVPMPVLRQRAPAFTLVADAPAQCDLGDGAGAHELAPGATATAAYPPGSAEAAITLRRNDDIATSRLAISDAPAPRPQETWPLPGGSASVLLAAGHDALRAPLVAVEGFPGGHGFLFSHDVLAQHGLLAELQARGYDLVVVGLQDGKRSLRANAEVVCACLREVAKRTGLPVTLLGWSMGGLLARIALAQMEQRGEPHRVLTLLSWDSPHRGSMTALAVQWLLRQLAPAHPALQPYRELIDSEANREMDMLVLDAHGAPREDPVRTALVAQLDWPRRPRRILLACGRGDGVRSLAPGALLVHWRDGDAAELRLRAMGTGDEPLASGRLNGSALPELQVPGTTAWDGMPGGRETYPLQVATLLRALLGGRTAPQRPPSTCTVPTVSALDLDAPPEAPVAADPCRITCASDQPHLTIDDAAATRLLEALGAPFDPDRFDPHDPAFLSDPFPTYARFREFAPIHHVPLYDSLWCFRAQDCRAILTATDIWYKHPPGGEPAPPGPMSALTTLPAGLFSSDPPAHPQLRAAVTESLDRVLPQAPELAAKHAKQLLASIGASSRVEFVQDFALPLPAAVLFDLLGLADDPLLRQVLIGWQQAVASAHDITQSPGLRLQGATSAMALRTFFAGLVHAHRQAAPGAASGGLIGAVCDAFGARALGEPELEATLVDLLVAGYLSTTFLLATGVWRLLSSAPAALEQLRTTPQHIPAAVEELLRLDGPVQVIDRYATSPTTLGDRQIAPGTRATAVVGSADRDPSVLQGPDEVRLDRGAGHMAFGAGIHTCVGAPLVRLVAPRALQTLLELTTLIELDGEPQWQTDPYLRAVVSLPLRLER